jgi:hypothetical protein
MSDNLNTAIAPYGEYKKKKLRREHQSCTIACYMKYGPKLPQKKTPLLERTGGRRNKLSDKSHISVKRIEKET